MTTEPAKVKPGQGFNATGFASKHAPEAIPLHFADLGNLVQADP